MHVQKMMHRQTAIEKLRWELCVHENVWECVVTCWYSTGRVEFYVNDILKVPVLIHRPWPTFFKHETFATKTCVILTNVEGLMCKVACEKSV